MPEKGAHRDAIDALQAPRAAAVVLAEELDEVGEISRVGPNRVRRDVALFGKMIEVVGNFCAHRAAPASRCESRHTVMSTSARSAIFSRLSRLSFTRSGRSS